jgi:four helix bundle suffix protein
MANAIENSKGFIPAHGGYEDLVSYETYRSYIETRPAEVVANILICLIHQTNYLLNQQIRQLEKAFLKDGGLRKRMTRARLATRARNREA